VLWAVWERVHAARKVACKVLITKEIKIRK